MYRAPLAVSWIIVVVVAGTSAQSGATQDPPPTVAQAVARLQAQDPAGAVKILEAVTAREPENVAAWRTLGAALLQTREYDRAIAALDKALALQPAAPVVLYNLACAYARKDEGDRAIDYLVRVRDGGNFDLTRIEGDPDLASIRTHPRFRSLMPTDAAFADPFVEPVTVIREWRGEGPNDQFGWIARNIGDVDGDAVNDIVTSAPTSRRGGERAGRVYVYSTLAGRLLWTADGRANDQLGIGIEAAGDANADGVPMSSRARRAVGKPSSTRASTARCCSRSRELGPMRTSAVTCPASETWTATATLTSSWARPGGARRVPTRAARSSSRARTGLCCSSCVARPRATRSGAPWQATRLATAAC
jgi:hypothetical protein